MRLLHARTHQLHHFFGEETPPYAILSHTWGHDEVTFKDVKKLTNLAPARRKKGWRKIDLTCKQALRDGLEYAWVDTCCIDKSSSAELSEAINSMYKWYEGSVVCYVWLEDFGGAEMGVMDIDRMEAEKGNDPDLREMVMLSPGAAHDMVSAMDSTFESPEWTSTGQKNGTEAKIGQQEAPALSSRLINLEDFTGEFTSSLRMEANARRSSETPLNPPRPRTLPRAATEDLARHATGKVLRKMAVAFESHGELPMKTTKHDAQGEVYDMKDCRWFTRGWTLQELLAPPHVIFFNKQWQNLGSKHDLSSTLSQYTRIPRTIIERKTNVQSVSVAQRMSWASTRRTTRDEDLAYCLLGIFNVNMSLLYGEGKRAFIRLQEEILRETDDQSLFAWSDPSADPNTWHGLFASSPSMFSGCGKFVSFRDWAQPSLAGMTSSGLSITIPLVKESGDNFLARLNCMSSPYESNTNGSENSIVICLQRLPGQGNHYARIRATSTMQVHGKSWTPTQVITRQNPVKPKHGDINMARSLFINSIRAEDDHLDYTISVWAPVRSKPYQLIDSRRSLDPEAISSSSNTEPIPLSSNPSSVDVVLALQPKFYFSDTAFPFFILLGPGPDPGTVACRYLDEAAANSHFACPAGYDPACADCFARLTEGFREMRMATRYFHRDGTRDRTISVDSSFDEKRRALAVDITVGMGTYGRERLAGAGMRDERAKRENRRAERRGAERDIGEDLTTARTWDVESGLHKMDAEQGAPAVRARRVQTAPRW